MPDSDWTDLPEPTQGSPPDWALLPEQRADLTPQRVGANALAAHHATVALDREDFLHQPHDAGIKDWAKVHADAFEERLRMEYPELKRAVCR